MRCLFLKNWVIEAPIGAYPAEKNKHQRLRLNIELYQDDSAPAATLNDVINYDTHKTEMTKIIQARHRDLLETLAAELAESALKDENVQRVTIEIEKLDVFSDAESCGIRIDRAR
jgi:FolB domain-containing protein